MFLILGIVLMLMWLGGVFLLHVTAWLIHVLLLLAVASIALGFLARRA